MAYVAPSEVAAELGATTPDARYDRACDAATAIVDHFCGRLDPMPDPPPEDVHQAALELAVDLLRRPGAPFGYFATDVTIASIGPDAARRVKSLLRPYKQSWGIS